jgi:hypothetical protein
MTRITLSLLLIAAAACGSKKESKAERDELCSAQKKIVASGLEEQAKELEASGDKEDAAAMRTVLGTLDTKWDAFCHALTQQDIECLEQSGDAVDKPECQHVLDSMKTQLLGM